MIMMYALLKYERNEKKEKKKEICVSIGHERHKPFLGSFVYDGWIRF